MEPTKTCTHCGLSKPRSEFRRNTRGLRSRCKSCENAKNKYALTAEIRRASEVRVRRAHPERHHRRRVQTAYGITPEDYEALLQAQDGKCAICGKECITGRRLAVDHDHETGHVRGLLCSNCNTGIGLLEDDVSRLLDAAEYLQQPARG